MKRIESMIEFDQSEITHACKFDKSGRMVEGILLAIGIDEFAIITTDSEGDADLNMILSPSDVLCADSLYKCRFISKAAYKKTKEIEIDDEIERAKNRRLNAIATIEFMDSRLVALGAKP